MRNRFRLLRPWLVGGEAAHPAGGRTLFYASDLILLFILVAALVDIALSAFG